MIDAHLRGAARAAAMDDSPGAREAEILARIRAGGRDPRRRPAAGDLVLNVHGRARRVAHVWPLVVSRDVGPRGGRLLQGAIVERLELRAGGEWMFLALRSRAMTGRQGDESIWGGPSSFMAAGLPSAPGCLWAQMNGRWHDELCDALEDRGDDAPSVVEFRYAAPTQNGFLSFGYAMERPLGTWRRWARDGRVLELGT